MTRGWFKRTITWSFSYILIKQKRRRWQTKLAILIAMAVQRCNTKCIAQWRMSRAISEATGCCHQATTCSVMPQRPPGSQLRQQRWENTPCLLAILMAMAMRRYVIACIARWRRSRAMLDVTGCHQRASIAADSSNWSHICHFFQVFSSSTCTKGLELAARPLIAIGVWHINLMGKS